MKILVHCSILVFLDFWHEWVLNFILAETENQKVLCKGAMSRPAHVQDFCLLRRFSNMSSILDLRNQDDFWQQTSVYSTVLFTFLLVYLGIFFAQFYRREIMISDEATESVAVSFPRCR